VTQLAAAQRGREPLIRRDAQLQAMTRKKGNKFDTTNRTVIGESSRTDCRDALSIAMKVFTAAPTRRFPNSSPSQNFDLGPHSIPINSNATTAV
jgi:hypothetical protein